MAKNLIVILIYVIGFFCIYLSVLLLSHFNNSKYLKNIAKINIKSKISNISFIQKLKIYIIKNCEISHNKFISPVILVIISLIIGIITFFVSYKVLKIFSSAVILSVYSVILPIQIIRLIKQYNKRKVFSVFPIYLSTLKNYTKTQNDIVSAFKNSKPNKEVEPYITSFNNKVENGVKVYDAFEEMKDEIKIGKISDFITMLEYCYINGGDFTPLIDKYTSIIMKINIQNESDKEKSFSTKAVLIFLIIINLYMLFGFVMANPLYKDIIINSFFGKLIVNINIISYLIIFIIFQKIDEMEE